MPISAMTTASASSAYTRLSSVFTLCSAWALYWARSGRRPVQHEAMHPARVRRLGPDRVDDHGERGPGPGLDQPGGLAVGDHQFRAGRGQVAEGGYDRGPGAVVVSWNLPAIRLTYSADGNDLDLVHVQDFSVGEEIIWIIGEDQGPTVPCDRS